MRLAGGGSYSLAQTFMSLVDRSFFVGDRSFLSESAQAQYLRQFSVDLTGHLENDRSPRRTQLWPKKVTVTGKRKSVLKPSERMDQGTPRCQDPPGSVFGRKMTNKLLKVSLSGCLFVCHREQRKRHALSLLVILITHDALAGSNIPPPPPPPPCLRTIGILKSRRILYRLLLFRSPWIHGASFATIAGCLDRGLVKMWQPIDRSIQSLIFYLHPASPLPPPRRRCYRIVLPHAPPRTADPGTVLPLLQRAQRSREHSAGRVDASW